ncbi:SDR family NAD(P)-dependent oxidoreductase [Ornithinimicrobium cerasi]|uniref:NADP-dependent 3-hydroxy acid dehydrogenase YdfG n=1 Tax=Ornithinimicrobium cerasi TaxID=2248773 RepID=A0A285VB14_9MICO|nr:SDR family NAD(P)-dependent oxidoreductase [Ornithinimicrobium cerasi]SOC51322.1 NADP-dependent 3-hydroxy acid dehydrogenase YdfG [Ornithinimicrobium cerasi]
MSTRPTAVVTGASGGIGRACAVRLAQDGYDVWVTARRADRVREVADEIGGRALAVDVTDPQDVARLAAEVGDRLDVLVNNAGGALGMDPVAEADLDGWRTMFETNVLGTVSVTKALLPALRAADHGTIVVIGSTAGGVAYEGGGGYCAAKYAERAVVDTLRLELNGTRVRISEIAPGMVNSESFSLTRLHGDEEAAAKVYAGVEDPLTQEDVAECVAWVVSLPGHVNIDRMVVRPVAQAAAHKVHRAPLTD